MKCVEKAIDKTLEDNDCSDLQIIALFENNGTVTRFSRNADVFNGNSLGDLVCIGSGTIQAIDVLRETVSSLPDVLQNAIAIDGLKVALLFAGAMHAREVAGMETIVDAFGGGIEICYFTDEGLKKLDKLAFAYVEFEQVDGKIMYAPLSFSNQYYVDLDLIIYTARLQTAVPQAPTASSCGNNSNLRREVFIIAPPNKMVGAIRIERIVQSLHFDYEFLCTCFIEISGGNCFVEVQSADIGGWMRIKQNGQSQFELEINSERFRQFDELLKTKR